MPTARKLIIDMTAMVGIGVLLAMLGPFGTFDAPFAVRLLYWLAMMLASYWLFMPILVGAGHAAARLNLPEAAMWAAGCALASVPMSVVVWCANFLWSPARWPDIDAAVMTYANVLVLGGIVCTIQWFASANRRHPPSTPPAQAPTPMPAAEPRLFDRLPPHLGRALIALEMEDHYIRVHTTLGSTLILLRMRDAVAELDGIDGAQVHRSWWVARAAVSGVKREGRNVRLALNGGIEAPVARTMAAALQAKGWF